ncbi:MAG: hypothetical protein OXH11_18590 [Candidatus Aminicenantes bacterium]|nr:hypothetical protein [Candidatus Aminicenantes bacterium]
MEKIFQTVEVIPIGLSIVRNAIAFQRALIYRRRIWVPGATRAANQPVAQKGSNPVHIHFLDTSSKSELTAAAFWFFLKTNK